MYLHLLVQVQCSDGRPVLGDESAFEEDDWSLTLEMVLQWP